MKANSNRNSMESIVTVFLFLIFSNTCQTSQLSETHAPPKSYPGSPANEDWGYSQVSPGGYYFWWLYKSDRRSAPLIIWLQGGEDSSTALGNFVQIGPYDVHFDKRPNTWLKYADIVFVDNYLGAGFSYTTDHLMETSGDMVAQHLLTWFQDFMQKHPEYKKRKLYIIGQSLGGLMAVKFARLMVMTPGQHKISGVGLLSPYISLIDYVANVPEYLYAFSVIDDAEKVKISAAAGALVIAAQPGIPLLSGLPFLTYYNLLQDTLNGTSDLNIVSLHSRKVLDDLPNKYTPILNGPIKKYLSQKVRIHSDFAFKAKDANSTLELGETFNAVPDVDFLLTSGIKVTIASGQFDVQTNLLGQYSWINRLKWPGLSGWINSRRETFDGKMGGVKAFRKRYNNFAFYNVLGSGHMISIDKPVVAIKIMREIIKS